MSGSDEKTLWGQEFKVVKWGLAEDQVVTFVTDLINQRDSLLEQQQHLYSLQKLAEKTVIEANELADSIKQEAQNEAARITEEAEEKTRESNELAESIKQEAQNEAARIVEEAEEKTRESNELAESIKQEAQDEATRITEEAEAKSQEIASEAQAQAETVVAEAGEQAEGIRREAQSKAGRATKDADEKARKIEAEAQEQAEKIIAEANERAESIKQEAQDEATRITEEAEAKTHAIADEVQKRAEEEAGEEVTKILQGARQEAVTIIETSKRHVLNEVTSIRDRFLPHLENLVTEIRAIGDEIGPDMVGAVEEEGPETLALSTPAPESNNNGEMETSKAEADLESEFATLVANATQAEEESQKDEDEADNETLTPASELESELEAEDSDLHEGEIEIAVTPPVNIAQLIRVRRNLQEVSHLKILRTDGSWNGGSIITVLMDKPLPLVNILKGMPEVEKAEIFTGEAEADSDFLRGLAFESKSGSGPGQNIVVSLKGNADGKKGNGAWA